MAHHFKLKVESGKLKIKKLTEAAKKFEVSLSFLKEKLDSRKGSGTSDGGNEVERSVDIRLRCTLKTEHCLIMMQYYEKATVKENFLIKNRVINTIFS